MLCSCCLTRDLISSFFSNHLLSQFSQALTLSCINFSFLAWVCSINLAILLSFSCWNRQMRESMRCLLVWLRRQNFFYLITRANSSKQVINYQSRSFSIVAMRIIGPIRPNVPPIRLPRGSAIPPQVIINPDKPNKMEAHQGTTANPSQPHSPVRPSRAHFRPTVVRESERGAVTAQKVHQNKKDAYRHYIREIYTRINEQLKKKNSFLTVTHSSRHVDCSLSLTAKELRPLRSDPASIETKQRSANLPKQRSEREEDGELKRKLVGEKLRLQRLQDDTVSIQRIKQKLMAMRKQEEQQRKEAALRKQLMALSKTQRQFKQSQAPQLEHLPKRQFFKQKRRQRIYSLNATTNASRLPAEDYIMNKFLFAKKEPFVCGLGEKQGALEKQRQKVLGYIDFLWKANYACGLFIRSQPEQIAYKAYVGSGNNSLMLKAILKRRFWWNLSDKPEGCNLVWTQLKVNNIFRVQQPSCSVRGASPAFVGMEGEQCQGQQMHARIFNYVDLCNWRDHLSRNSKNQLFINERTYLKRAGLLACKGLQRIQDPSRLVIHNHLEQNYYIGNKKALFYNMRAYYQRKQMNIFDALPLTFHIVKGVDDPQYKLFFNYYSQLQEKKRRGEEEKNIWIVKPGQYSNRGHGITVCHSLDDVLLRLRGKQRSGDGSVRTFILQKYIEKPLLYKSRKFDIRHYLLISCINGSIRAYWYPQGYIRTSSAAYSLARNSNLLTHLTNDAVQKHSDDYGKYEKGNKVSYEKFQVYLDKTLRGQNQKGLFYKNILPQMKQLAINAVRATYFLLDPRRKEHNFELLGMDFMIDQSLKPWLIEINTNPCLQLSSPLLSRLIPALIENTFRLCVDPFFPPPEGWSSSKRFAVNEDALNQNRFELIFDQTVDGKEVQQLFQGDLRASAGMGKVEEDAQVYQNEGAEEWDEGKHEAEI